MENNLIFHIVVGSISLLGGGIVLKIYQSRKVGSNNQINVKTENKINTQDGDGNGVGSKNKRLCPEHFWISKEIETREKKFESIDRKQDLMCEELASLREEIHLHVNESKIRWANFESSLNYIRDKINGNTFSK